MEATTEVQGDKTKYIELYGACRVLYEMLFRPLLEMAVSDDDPEMDIGDKVLYYADLFFRYGK